MLYCEDNSICVGVMRIILCCIVIRLMCSSIMTIVLCCIVRIIVLCWCNDNSTVLYCDKINVF